MIDYTEWAPEEWKRVQKFLDPLEDWGSAEDAVHAYVQAIAKQIRKDMAGDIQSLLDDWADGD